MCLSIVGNCNNSADEDGAEGDRINEMDTDELSAADDMSGEDEQRLLSPQETGQGDAREIPVPCTGAARCVRFVKLKVLTVALLLSFLPLLSLMCEFFFPDTALVI